MIRSTQEDPTMKLYYSPGACSLAPHIALHEAGINAEAVKVDLRTHRLADGTDYYAINPKGYVPLLELDTGERLTEVAVILQYIADRKPGTIAPVFGSLERYRAMEWLNFIATELHKQFSPLWAQDTPEPTKAAQRAKLASRFDLVAKTLAAQPYLAGAKFGIADAYLFTILNWSGMLAVDLSPWPALQDFQARVAARPAVQAALKVERAAKAPMAKAPAAAEAA
jgi:glutathione S-transferase